MTSLKSQATAGVRWTTLNTICTTILQFIQLAILGRLLGPEAFGLIAMVMVVIGFAQVFADVGLSSAIIQRRNPSRDELSTLYWVNIVAGFIIYLIIYLLTPLVAKGFSTAEINSLLPVAGLAFVISPFGIQFRALLHKALRFDLTTKITVVSAFVGMAVAISCALKGYGVWSLVWGSLSNIFSQTGLLVVCGMKRNIWPRLHFKWSDTKGYLSFGLYRVGAMSVNYLNSRVDQLIIGAFMGPVALGYYNIAFRLVLEPIQKLNPILTSVAFPVFSIVQDDTARLKKGFLQMIRFLMTINAPLLIGLACVAPIVVPILIGKQWTPSIPLVQVLAFYALIRSFGNAGGSLIMGKGKANWTFYWNVALILIIPPVVYLASLDGEIIYIAFALVGMQVMLSLCHYRFLIRNIIGHCFSEYLHALGRPILLAIVMGAIVLASSLFMLTFSIAVRAFVQVGIGALAYIVLSWFFQREMIVEIVELLPARLRLGKLLKQFV